MAFVEGSGAERRETKLAPKASGESALLRSAKSDDVSKSFPSGKRRQRHT